MSNPHVCFKIRSAPIGRSRTKVRVSTGGSRHENQQHACGLRFNRAQLRFGVGTADHRCPRFARRHHHNQRKTNSAPRSEIRRGDQREGFGVKSLVAAARCTAKWRAKRVAHYDGRCRLRLAVHFWRGDPYTDARPYRRKWAALHQFPLHFALLTDAGGDYHGTQPSFGGFRRGRRNSDGVPGLRLNHPD